jgi:hypothetical protein
MGRALGRPHKVRVVGGYRDGGGELAVSAQEGSNAATSSGPVPDSTGSGVPARPVRTSTNVTPTAASAARFGCQTGWSHSRVLTIGRTSTGCARRAPRT